jgi:hypothetical protein
MDSAERRVRELVPLVRGFTAGPAAIALGGSHAKGSGDALSDLDVYLFADAVLPARLRDGRVTDALGAGAGVQSWGGDEPFVQGGTDFLYRGLRVECWLRRVDEVERTIEAALRGEIRREYSGWAVMGFYGHVALADVHTLRIVEDPLGTLARWKAAVAGYPEALRRALIGRFLAQASSWPGNPHYASAVERDDVIYASAIVQQVTEAVIQVVFALNRAYFPGEKMLGERLEALPIRPADLAARLRGLLTCAGGLRAQHRELGTLVAETARLAAIHGAED